MDGDKEARISGDDEDEGGGVNIWVGINNEQSVFLDASFSTRSWFTPATRDDPPEGETNLLSLDIEEISLIFTPTRQRTEEDDYDTYDYHEITASEVTNVPFTYANIEWLADTCLCNHIPAEDDRKITAKGAIKEIPPLLIEKIEKEVA